MVKSSILFFLVLFVTATFGQEVLRLSDCRDKAKANYPVVKKSALFEEITNLKKQNYRAAYLPSVDFKAQATYQSEVIEIDIPVPGFDFEALSRDQYKAYFDVKQSIWDGNVTKSRQAFEEAGLEAQNKKLDIQAFQLMEMVDAFFFNILLMDENLNILQKQKEILDARIQRIENAQKYGAARNKDLLKLNAESIGIDQTALELNHKRELIINILGILCGEDFFPKVVLEIPHLDTGAFIARPELEYFALQKQQFDAANDLLKSARNPKLFGFAQAGYGKPGLNMLKNEFDPYYIVGVGLNWKVMDWRQSERNKEINELNKQIVDVMRDDFLQKQKMKLAESVSKISLCEKQVKEDEKLLEIRQQVLDVANSELENGSITSTDYLSDFYAKALAEVKKKMHEIELLQAKVEYERILGRSD